MIPIFETTALVVLAAMLALWLVSLRISNASIVDIFWGIGFVVIAWTAHVVSGNSSPRAWLIVALATSWGVRLAVHLAIRNVGHGEDFRYRAMREKYGSAFPFISLGTVFLLQGALMWIISLPLQAAHAPGEATSLGWLDALGAITWLTGIVFEAVADAQLARFKRSPGAAGAVMDRGLWRYSRHPNYFGDCLVWWGFGAIGVAAGAWWSLAGPVVMTVLLLQVSGVALLESTIADRRPGYREYAARTSAFVPWWPRR